MNETDDALALTLTLKCPDICYLPPPPVAAVSIGTTRFPLNLLSSPPLPFVHRHHVSNHQKLPFIISHAIPPPDADLNLEMRSYASGTDGNRRPLTSALVAVTTERDDEALLSSPNSTVSSVSGKRTERESTSQGLSGDDDDDDDDGGEVRKKLRLSKDQALLLEETFKHHHTLNPKQKLALAKQLDLRPRQVEVWFQNRRARTKLKQTEVDCEYLKRCCDTLTEENKRLQKEVNELRALKLSPQFYMNMNPPTTLTMCPQCERVAVSTSSTSSSMTANDQKGNSRFLSPDRYPRPWVVELPICPQGKGQNEEMGNDFVGLK